MNRQDYDLAKILKYENVAWFSDGIVRILDRRYYPAEERYVDCKTHLEVAAAIRDMVTQSAGPYTAAGMGMALAAYNNRELKGDELMAVLEDAAEALSTARPTTTSRMRVVTEGCLEAAKNADKDGREPYQAIFDRTIDSLNRRYKVMQIVGDNLASLFKEDSVIMTQCYGETIVGTMLRAANRMGIKPQFVVPETRPFLQGAKLTASVIHEMGFELKLISDNMAAWAISHYGVNLFTSAADTITTDGYVVNKVGTLQIAILAKHFGVPYYVTGIPDDLAINDVDIEFRNPNEITSFMGLRTTLEGVEGIYPAFDITPPELVTGYVTDRGILKLDELKEYKKEKTEFY